MNAYSKDSKLKILEALDLGVSRKEAVGIFGVSITSTIAPATPRPNLRARPDLGREARRAMGLLASIPERGPRGLQALWGFAGILFFRVFRDPGR